MPDRLSPLDASLLYREEVATVSHVGTVTILEVPPPGDGEGVGLDHDGLLALVADRIGESSRYRQRVREVPGRLAGPVWVDDVDFDLGYHVRRSALPSPGTLDQLAEFVARTQSRPLDRERPLWEVYLVEGLEGGRLALVTKTHQALVDGVTAVDIGHLLLDAEPATAPPDPRPWTPRPEPGDLELVVDAVADTVGEALRRPVESIERVGGGLVDGAVGAARRALGGVGQVVGQLARSAAGPAPSSALLTRVRSPRRFAMIATDLDDYRAVREAVAAAERPLDASITDIALTVVTGGLRTWLQSRGEPVHSATTVRAVVPFSVADPAGEGDDTALGGTGGDVLACFVDLPVGESNPRLRLERVAYQTRRQAFGAQAVPASVLAGIAGFAPGTLHHLGSRVATAMSRRMFGIAVTNVPGPQRPLYVGGARAVATWPVMPLTRGHSVTVGLTSYDGRVFVGINADRAAVPDLDVLADGMVESLAEIRTVVVDGEGEA